LRSHAYRPDIDGLRAIAILSVIGFHAFPTVIPGGFVGVDIFFVISGFLISGILFAQSEQGNVSIRGFYARRIRRIFPALILVLATTLALGWWMLPSDELSRLGGDVAASAGFVSNIRLWHESGYFDLPSSTKPLLHLWSLGIEEQFYIIWPLTIVLIGRKWKTPGVFLPVFLACSFLANLLLIDRSQNAAFYLPISRFWELLAGGLLAAHGNKLRPSATRAWCGVALITGSVFLLDQYKLFPGWWALPPVAGAFLLISAGPEAWPNRRLFSNSALVFIGLISYPLYLWHWPLLTFARLAMFGTPPVAIRILVILSSGLLAWLTYRFIERPIRARSIKAQVRATGGWAVPGALFSPGTLCVYVALIALIGVFTSSGRRQAADPLAPFHDSTRVGAGINELVADGCGMAGKDPGKLTYCQSDRRQPPTYALLGDSHAGALFPALVRGSADQERWMLVGKSACVPALGIMRLATLDAYDARECASAAENLVHAVAANPNVKAVVIFTAARVTGTLTPELSEGRTIRYARAGSLKADPDAVAIGLSATIALLAAAGKHVVLGIDNPSLPDPMDCVRNIKGFGLQVNPACSISRAQADADYRNYRALIADLEHRNPQLSVFDPTDLLCPDAQCRVVNNGVSFYSYSDHLSDIGGDIVAHALIAFLHQKLPG
jgi:peptidoglycan/LPS O-acetylase OafA/YrhL